jgi:sugar phosphate isomerase/epimerase
MPDAEIILPQIVKACREVSAYAKNHGIECLYEEQGYVFNGISDFGKLISAICGCGIVLDTGNILFADEQIAPFAGKYANRVAHVHVKDYIVKPGNGQCPGRDWYLSRGGNYIRGTVIGHGVVDFVQTFRVLMTTGYDGYYSLEFDGPEDPLYAAETGLENIRYYIHQAKQQMDIIKAKDLI